MPPDENLKCSPTVLVTPTIDSKNDAASLEMPTWTAWAIETRICITHSVRGANQSNQSINLGTHLWDKRMERNFPATGQNSKCKPGRRTESETAKTWTWMYSSKVKFRQPLAPHPPGLLSIDSSELNPFVAQRFEFSIKKLTCVESSSFALDSLSSSSMGCSTVDVLIGSGSGAESAFSRSPNVVLECSSTFLARKTSPREFRLGLFIGRKNAPTAAQFK